METEFIITLQHAEQLCSDIPVGDFIEELKEELTKGIYVGDTISVSTSHNHESYYLAHIRNLIFRTDKVKGRVTYLADVEIVGTVS